MGLPRDLVKTVRRLDEPQLRQLLILARGLLLDTEAAVVDVDDLPGLGAVQYRQKTVRCNKDACGTCPHGPYWYAHWHEGGRKRSQYIGSELPAQVRAKVEAMERERQARIEESEGPRLRIVG